MLCSFVYVREETKATSKKVRTLGYPLKGWRGTLLRRAPSPVKATSMQAAFVSSLCVAKHTLSERVAQLLLTLFGCLERSEKECARRVRRATNPPRERGSLWPSVRPTTSPRCVVMIIV